MEPKSNELVLSLPKKKDMVIPLTFTKLSQWYSLMYYVNAMVYKVVIIKLQGYY